MLLFSPAAAPCQVSDTRSFLYDVMEHLAEPYGEQLPIVADHQQPLVLGKQTQQTVQCRPIELNFSLPR
jgi:hypothetical protein